jgi:hypothetical protein
MGEVPDHRLGRSQMSERWLRCAELRKKVSQRARARPPKQAAPRP